jgi:hypothetical protein
MEKHPDSHPGSAVTVDSCNYDDAYADQQLERKRIYDLTPCYTGDH